MNADRPKFTCPEGNHDATLCFTVPANDAARAVVRLADAGTTQSAPEPSQAATEAHSDQDRVQRYGEALGEAMGCHNGAACDECAVGVDAVMAVADAEQAELRAEVERLTAERDAAQEHVAYHLRDYSLNSEATGDLAVDMAAYTGRLKIRAEAAEAKVARVEALAQYDPPRGYTADDLRAALDGDA